jgi:hypothetical protein
MILILLCSCLLLAVFPSAYTAFAEDEYSGYAARDLAPNDLDLNEDEEVPLGGFPQTGGNAFLLYMSLLLGAPLLGLWVALRLGWRNAGSQE